MAPRSLLALALGLLLPMRASAASESSIPRREASSALLVIDVQADFLPEGALPTLANAQLMPSINLLASGADWGLVVYTQDWHPPRQAPPPGRRPQHAMPCWPPSPASQPSPCCHTLLPPPLPSPHLPQARLLCQHPWQGAL